MAGQTVTVSVLADTKKFSSAMKGLGKATGLNKLGAAAKVAGKALAVGLGVGIAAAAVVTKKLIAAGEAAATSNSRIENITNQMALFGDQAGTVSKRLVDLANKTAMSTGEDQNAIKAAQAKLLTFKEIAKSADVMGGIFDRTTQATIDLAAAGFGTAEDNAVQLGKALNDPITGLSALTRSGITFTAAQKDMIKGMVEAGDTASAQEMILAAIEGQVGGTAAATRNATDRIKVAWSVVQEWLGLKLLPVLEKVSAWFLDTALPVIQKFAGELVDRTLPVLKTLSDWFKNEGLPKLQAFAAWIKAEVIPRIAALAGWITGTLIPGLVKMVKWIQDNRDWLAAIAITIGTVVLMWKAYTTALAIWSAATKVAAAVQLAFNAVMAVNPIVLIVIAIAALVAGLVYFFTQTETGKEAWATFTAALVTGWEWITNAFATGYAAVTDWLGKARDFIITAWNTVTAFIGGIPGNIKAVFLGALGWLTAFGTNIIQGLKDGITSRWETALAWVQGIPARLKAGVGNMGTTLLQTGKDLINGLKNGIGAAARGLARKVLDPIKGAVNGVKNFLGIRSPSRLFKDIGKNTVTGLALGLKDVGEVDKAMGKVSVAVAGGYAPRPTFTASPGTGTVGNTYHITVNTGVGDPVSIGREVSKALTAFERVNGGRR